MTGKRMTGAGPLAGSARFFRKALIGVAAVSLAATPAFSARTSPSFRTAQGEVQQWQAHSLRSLWVVDGQLRPEARQLIDLVRTARLDGLDPDAYRIRTLEGAVRAAYGGNPRDLQRADFMLSQVLVAYARDMRAFRPDVYIPNHHDASFNNLWRATEPLFQALKDENPKLITLSKAYREPVCFNTEYNLQRRRKGGAD